MVDIEMLQARHGDAFILHCKKGNQKGVVVVDGGPFRKSYEIVETLNALGTIDLMVLSHFDDDHIGGILQYIYDHKDDRPFPVKEMWLNCAYDAFIHTSSDVAFGQAKALADVLDEINKKLVSENYPCVNWKQAIVASQKPIELPFADIIILSPDSLTKQKNDENYEAEIKANISKDDRGTLDISLEELALNRKGTRGNTVREVVNQASIAFLIQCDNFSALMLGDGHPETILDSLTNLKYTTQNRLKVDFVKVAHHGSRHNTSNSMLDLIDCNKFLISTNGGSGSTNHPDRETIANIVCHPLRDKSIPIDLYFNYDLPSIECNSRKFLNDSEPDDYNFCVHENIQKISTCNS